MRFSFKFVGTKQDIIHHLDGYCSDHQLSHALRQHVTDYVNDNLQDDDEYCLSGVTDTNDQGDTRELFHTLLNEAESNTVKTEQNAHAVDVTADEDPE